LKSVYQGYGIFRSITLINTKSRFEYSPAVDLSGFQNLTGLDPTSLFDDSGAKERSNRFCFMRSKKSGFAVESRGKKGVRRFNPTVQS